MLPEQSFLKKINNLKKNTTYAFIVYSDDQGKTWKQGKETLDLVSTESSVVELSDGRIMLNSRSKGAYRTVGYSADGGDTFDSFEEKI